jgi:hypothetical protein
MKTKNIIFLLAMLMMQVSFAQTAKKAKITDLLFFRMTKEDVKQLSMHLGDDDIKNSIIHGLEKTISEKYGVTEFEYLKGKNITFVDGFTLKGMKTRKIAKSEKKPGTLYIGIQASIITPTYDLFQESYRFVTTVKVFNEKGKKVQSNVFDQIFQPSCEEKIVGPDLISKRSFLDLYVGGAKAALNKQKSDDNNIKYVKLDLAESYSELYKNTSKYSIKHSLNDYNFEDQGKNIQKMASYKVPGWFGFTESKTNYVNNTFGVNKLKETFKLENLLQKKSYKVKLVHKEKVVLQSISMDSDIKVKFSFDGKNVGLFTFDLNNKLSGELNDQDFSVVWKPEYFCSEIYENDILLGVINELSNDRVFYLNNTITSEKKAEIVNIIFAYDFAIGLRRLSYRFEREKTKHELENSN